MVCENLSSPTFETAVGAKDNDMTFLAELMNNTIVQSLVKVRMLIIFFIDYKKNVPYGFLQRLKALENKIGHRERHGI